MAHGYPDYAPVAGEVLGGKGYLTYSLNSSGSIAAGSYSTLDFGEVAEGYEVYQAIGIASAKGCDTGHAILLYANSKLWRINYFEDESAIFYPRHYIARGGDSITVKLYNWDAVARFMAWSAIGIILTLGTPPLNPQRDPGVKPKLKKEENLWFVEDTIFGKRWLAVKQQKIIDTPEAIFGYIESRKGA